MQIIKCMVASKQKVIRNGVALILGSAENIQVIGNNGADVVKETFELQPDLLVYELSPEEKNNFEVLIKVKDLCGWTKLILFSSTPLNKEDLKQYLSVCDGYMQGPLIPGFLLKSMELACYSGHFFFLGLKHTFWHPTDLKSH
ncbi:hypothetical protein [Desulfoscipio sp. XC116]|uniref:hypothetical protein n=1 Tax=Desulfoscipio sp. XC116 TaxID=3144975 RepID=UPI00325AA8FB